jgi:hypothetical protein
MPVSEVKAERQLTMMSRQSAFGFFSIDFYPLQVMLPPNGEK